MQLTSISIRPSKCWSEHFVINVSQTFPYVYAMTILLQLQDTPLELGGEWFTRRMRLAYPLTPGPCERKMVHFCITLVESSNPSLWCSSFRWCCHWIRESAPLHAESGYPPSMTMVSSESLKVPITYMGCCSYSHVCCGCWLVQCPPFGVLCL